MTTEIPYFLWRLALRGASDDVAGGRASYHPVPRGNLGDQYEYAINFEGPGHKFNLMDDFSFTASDMDAAEVVLVYDEGGLESLEEKVSYN